MLTLTHATPEHVHAMRGHVRQADIDELWDGYEVTPEEAMLHGLRTTDYPIACLAGDTVLCVMGVVRGDGGWSVPWMVAAQEVEQHRREFLKESRRVLGILFRLYGPMHNYVDARNHRCIVWLRWCGFRLEAPAAYGKHGLDFCHFSMKEHPCATN